MYRYISFKQQKQTFKNDSPHQPRAPAYVAPLLPEHIQYCYSAALILTTKDENFPKLVVNW